MAVGNSMGKIGRFPLRTYVYSGILLYLALLCVGMGIEFIWFILQESSALTQTKMGAVTPEEGLWEFFRLDGAMETIRMWAIVVLKPLAVFISGKFPLAGALILSYSLVALGIVALVVAACFFAIVDLLTNLSRKMTGRR